MRGGEKVLELLCDIFPAAPVYTLLCEPQKLNPRILEGRSVHTSWFQRSALSRRHYRYLLPLMPSAMERLDLQSYDLVVSSSHCVAKGVRVSKNARHISYCHTPMRYLWDLQEEYFGSPGLAKRLVLNPLLNGLRHWDVRTSKRVDHFIANSRFVADRIRRVYSRESDVIHPPVDAAFFTPGNEKGDYFLMVSALVPYKKVELAVEAFRNISDPLLIVGSGPMEKELRKSAPPNVRFLGWQGMGALREHYSKCRALLFPQKEDFGIVPLEAQACGRPVIAFGEGGALETVVGHSQGRTVRGSVPALQGKATGLFFRDQTVEGLLEAIEIFKKLENTFDAGDIRRNALQFDKERCRENLKRFILAKVPAAQAVLSHA